MLLLQGQAILLWNLVLFSLFRFRMILKILRDPAQCGHTAYLVGLPAYYLAVTSLEHWAQPAARQTGRIAPGQKVARNGGRQTSYCRLQC